MKPPKIQIRGSKGVLLQKRNKKEHPGKPLDGLLSIISGFTQSRVRRGTAMHRYVTEYVRIKDESCQLSLTLF